MTQRTLADRLGISEQQVQRWEATAYAGVGLDRLQDIADALGSRIREETSPTAAPPDWSRYGAGGTGSGKTMPSYRWPRSQSISNPPVPTVGAMVHPAPCLPQNPTGPDSRKAAFYKQSLGWVLYLSRGCPDNIAMTQDAGLSIAPPEDAAAGPAAVAWALRHAVGPSR